MAINHLGFDEDGKLTGLLTELKVPFASWYVDSPTYILYGGEVNCSPYCTLFCWERSYLKPVEDMGFQSPTFLPLATDPEVFTPAAGKGESRFAARLSFVGDSMETARKKWEKKLPHHVNRALEAGMAGGMKIDRQGEILDHFPPVADHSTGNRSRVDIEAALVWKTTQEYRLSLVCSLIPLGLIIYGDGGWNRLVSGKEVLRPPVAYFTELPQVYCGTSVNVNCTSLQMKTAVNQRVFDVPACGGFLLSDYQDDMDRFFEVGKEAICYRTSDEAVALAGYYLEHESERLSIAEAARRRVLAEHTYEKRMASLVEKMRERYS